MTRRQMGVCALVCGLAAGVWQASFAQQPRGTEPAKPQRPAPQVLRFEEPLSPELESLLKTWEQHSAAIKTLTGKHERSEFNSVFEVETRTEGKFFFQAPDKGRIDMKGKPIKPGEIGARLGMKGQPYKLQAGQEERWICSGKDIWQINDKAKEYEIIPIPEEYQGKNIIRSPLPFLFGLKAEEAKQRFQFRMMKSGDDYYSLEVVPRTGQDAFSKAYVKLDKQMFVPTGVILYDLAGSIETRYSFGEIKINEAGIAKKVAEIWKGDPFQPNLSNYKRVQAPVQQIANPPAGQKVMIAPPTQKQSGPLVPAPPARTVTAPGTSKTVQQPQPSTKR